MYSLHFIFLLISSVAADRLHLYRSEGCSNAKLGDYTPVEPGNCIEFDQARSYILEKDEGVTYNLYSGGGCGVYEGQVSVSTVCLGVGLDITGVMSIGRQDQGSIRGATRPKIVPTTVEKTTIEKKQLDGDAWQCPNIPSNSPYFFVVLSSSSTREDMWGQVQEEMQQRFMTVFHREYVNPSGQTDIENTTEWESWNMRDPVLRLNMIQGVIQDIQEDDMNILVQEFLNFRVMRRAPVSFVVQVFSGRLDFPEGPGGPVATLQFDGGI